MSIRKDVTVKITNNNATLDMPLQIYELDHGIELRFKLMDYKYKYTKDPQNILNSSDEDILEAYTTIINPRGYELQQINGEVKDDIVIFMIDSSYTDEIDEIGTYSLQIHIKCACSEFSIPPIQFEVLQRLKGIKVVTDGEDSIDDSALIDNYSNFISDETGKLLIEWKKGDIISSVKLNAMVEVINNAVDEEVQRQLNETKREQQELERQNKVREALNSVDARVDEAMIEYETRFNALTVSQQQDMEVIDARDGEVSLKARLDRDLRNPLQVYEDVEGSYISCDSTEGYAQNVEILGNTIQNQNNLADIRSVGDKVEGQELYEIPVLCTGKNLINVNDVIVNEGVNTSTGNFGVDSSRSRTPYIKFNPNTNYVATNVDVLLFYDKNKQFISSNRYSTGVSPSNCKYIVVRMLNTTTDWQLELGTVATSYEPYQEDKLTILSPVQLEKVGDIADRIICKDGVWGVEKNVNTKVFDGSEDWNINKTLSQDSDVFFAFKDAELSHVKPSETILSNKFLYNIRCDILGTVGIRINLASGLQVRIETNKLNSATSNDFKNWLNNNNLCVKYPTAQPQFIPLPHDQQVKLRTFANKTNISFGCEIEPTLKASVPKTIGASVNSHSEQIVNLGKEIDKIKKLEESVASEVVTESDFSTVENTSNGYFEDVKLDGRTLVNLRPINPIVVRDNCSYSNGKGIINVTNRSDVNAGSIQFDNSILRPNTVYTAIFKVSGDYDYKVGFDYGKNQGIVSEVTSGKHIISFTTASNIDRSGYLSFWSADIKQGQFIFENFIILEGDHTQNPPEYFEGIKSVGQDADEISVLSTNENLFDVKSAIEKHPSHLTSFGNGLRVVSGVHDLTYLISDVNKQYTVSWHGELVIQHTSDAYVGFVFAYTDGTSQYVGGEGDNILYSIKGKTIKEFKISYRNVCTMNLTNISLVQGDTPKPYKPEKQDKKPLLYYNPTTDTWEKPVLREWDSIEKHSDGKYYYHKRSGEVVLDGSENWRNRPDVTDDGVHVIFSAFTSFKYNKSSYMICDKFNPKSVGNANEAYSKGEGIAYYNYRSGSEYAIYYVISKSKLTSQDTQGFAQWLQANPITLVYQLETEEVYECTSIDLITYENETNFIVNAGAIAPVSTLKVMCNINNVVRELQQKVSNLEKYIQHVMIDALNNALNE